ncbi:Death domain-containing protein CRADD-like protein [Aix galericulata]|nr:Death domain-containing protein CRADD-like protein [Aix galericulata]
MASGEREALLGLQRALTEEEFEAFKFLLGGQLPLSRLHPATRPELCALLLQHFPGRALPVAAAVLRQLGRRDLLRQYWLPEEDEAPGEAGGRAQGAGGAGGAPGAGDARGAGGAPDAGGVHDAGGTRDAGGRPPRLLTERDLLLVAQKLGSEWQEVGIACLGLPQSRLEQIGEERPQRAVLRAFEMLREWRRRQQGGATAPRLLDCLRGAPVDPEVLELLQAM